MARDRTDGCGVDSTYYAVQVIEVNATPRTTATTKTTTTHEFVL